VQGYFSCAGPASRSHLCAGRAYLFCFLKPTSRAAAAANRRGKQGRRTRGEGAGSSGKETGDRWGSIFIVLFANVGSRIFDIGLVCALIACQPKHHKWLATLANRSANTHTLTHTRTLTTRVVTHNCECLLCACVSALIFFRFLWFLWGANAAYVQRVVNKMEALAQSKGPIIYAQTLPTFPQQMQHKRDFRLPFHWPPQSVRYSGENGQGPLSFSPTQDTAPHTWACHNAMALAYKGSRRDKKNCAF